MNSRSMQVSFPSATNILKHCHQEGRPLVMLLGAGISSDAGIPLAPLLSEYLIRLYSWTKLAGIESVASYVRSARWPSRHDLNIDLISAAREDTRRREQAFVPRTTSEIVKGHAEELFQSLLRHDLRNVSPLLADSAAKVMEVPELSNTTSYRSLLAYLCDGEQPLIDACFDHFIRDRRVTTTHQLIAFVAKLFQCQFVFSTNFDPLIERALIAESLSPVVYPVTGESSIPSPILLSNQQMSVVKLHGGPYQLRAGIDLDNPMSAQSMLVFSELFSQLKDKSNQEALMLVVGYSGSDRRVMDIVAQHLRGWKPRERGPRVIWVTRSGEAPSLLLSAVQQFRHSYERPRSAQDVANIPAALLRYRDSRLLFNDIHQVVARTFPRASKEYQALAVSPPSPANDVDDVFKRHFQSSDPKTCLFDQDGNPIEFSTVIVTRKKAEGRDGTARRPVTESLAYVADRMDRTHRTIWLDCSEIRSVSTLATIISEQVCRLDARANPLLRPLLLQGLFAPVEQFDDADHGKNAWPAWDKVSVKRRELGLFVRWLQHVLRRDRYLVVFDSVESFGGWHPAMERGQGGVEDNTRRSKLNDLQRDQQKLLVELLNNLLREPHLLQESRILLGYTNLEERKQPQTPNDLPIDQWMQRMNEGRENADANPAAIFRFACEYINPNLPFVSAARRNRRQSRDKKIAEMAIQVACCCRRPRSLTSMVGITTRMLNSANRSGSAGFKQSDVHDQLIRADGLFEQTLKRLDGGFYWYDQNARDVRYKKLLTKRGGYLGVAQTHAEIARFALDQVYAKSQDTRVLIEYMFHTISAVALMERESDKTIEGESAYDLAIGFKRHMEEEQEKLLSRGRLATVLQQVGRMIEECKVKDDSFEGATSPERLKWRELSGDLHRFAGRILLTCGYPHWAKKVFQQCLRNNVEVAVATSSLSLKSRKNQTIEDRDDKKPVDVLTRLFKAPMADNNDWRRDLETAVSLGRAIMDPVLLWERDKQKSSAKGNRTGRKAKPPLERKPWSEQPEQDNQFLARLFDSNESEKMTNQLLPRKNQTINQRDELMLLAARYFRWQGEYLLRNADITRFEPHFFFGTDQALEERQKNAKENEPPPAHSRTKNDFYPDWNSHGQNAVDCIAAVNKAERLLEGRFATAQSRRYLCYLRSRRALANVAQTVAKMRDGRVKGALETMRRTWDSAIADLESGAAALEREAGAGERLALGVTRLFGAELCLRMAEYCLPEAVDEFFTIKSKGKTRSRHAREEAESSKEFSPFSHFGRQMKQASYYLKEADPILEAARGENRWRWYRFHLMMRERFLSAVAQFRFGKNGDFDREKIESQLFWSARYQVAGFTNCGVRSDRHTISYEWWKTWNRFVEAFFAKCENEKPPTSDDEPPSSRMQMWRERLGLPIIPRRVVMKS